MVHSHKFLDNSGTINEKDFVVVNLTKGGYLIIIEVKASDLKYQKFMKQMFDAKEQVQRIFGAIGSATRFKYAGVFFAQNGSHKPLFNCNCSLGCSFTIIGRENIEKHLPEIEADIALAHDNWDPSKHIEEFLEIAKQILFIAQGDLFAPVTGSSLIDKIAGHVHDSSSFENIFFWTLEQLSVIEALQLAYVFLDAFYSTGKSEILKYVAKYWEKKGKIVHYLINRPDEKEDECTSKLPFTLMLENDLRKTNVRIKETTFKFGTDMVKPFR